MNIKTYQIPVYDSAADAEAIALRKNAAADGRIYVVRAYAKTNQAIIKNYDAEDFTDGMDAAKRGASEKSRPRSTERWIGWSAGYRHQKAMI